MHRMIQANPFFILVKRFFPLLFLSLFACISTTGGLPPGNPSSGYGITGFVGQSNASAAPGETVSLVDAATGRIVSEVQSNFVGKYSFYPVSPGRYRLRVGLVERGVTISNENVRMDVNLNAADGRMSYLPEASNPNPDSSKGAPNTSDQFQRGSSDNQLYILLTSSAWCSFAYNKRSGVTSGSRYRFLPNGTYRSRARGEVYASGTGGTYASQSDAGADGRWEVRSATLYISDGNGPLEPVDLKVTYNSNDSPILFSEGKEYSRCT